MSRIEEIERAIENLPSEEFASLCDWVDRRKQHSVTLAEFKVGTTKVKATAIPGKLEASEEPHPAEMIEIVRRAAEVLGIDHVSGWLQTKIPSLGGQTPYSLLNSQEGRDKIERVLAKIEHGVY